MYKYIMEWKWSKDEPYERSKRNIDQNNDKDKNVFEESAYTSSLNHDENTWDILNQASTSNKREYTDKKLAEREMVSQVSMNPYLSNNNYLDDISTRDTFLKPICSNIDREKKHDTDK